MGSGLFRGERLGYRKKIVVVIPEHRTPRHQLHFRHLRKFPDSVLNPKLRGLSIYPSPRRQKAPAKLSAVVGQYDASPCRTRLQCRRESGWPSPGNQNVAMSVHPVVFVGVRGPRRLPKSRRLANYPFICLPHTAGPHERLVIEAGRQESGQLAVNGCEVMIHTGPAVHTLQDHTIGEVHLRGPEVGCGARASADL